MTKLSEETRRQMEWVGLITPYLDSKFDLTSYPIGETNSKAGEIKRKMGARKGKADIEFYYQGFSGVRAGFIEVKLKNDQKLKDEQLEFQQWCEKRYMPHYVVGFINTFLDVLDKHGVIDKSVIYADQAGAIKAELAWENAHNEEVRLKKNKKAREKREKNKEKE